MPLNSAVILDLLDELPPRAARPDPVANPPLLLHEHPSPGHGAVTCANADTEASFAYAADFSTERQMLSREIAGERMLQVPVGTPHQEAARLVCQHLRTLGATHLNVTGSSLATLRRHFPFPLPELQAKVDGYLLRTLTAVHAQYPLAGVRSGGQSGVEEAAIKAAVTLRIPALALLPRDFLYRDATGADRTADHAATMRRLLPRRPAFECPF